MITRRHYIKRYAPLRRSRKPIRRDARTAEERRRDKAWRDEVMADGLYVCAMRACVSVRCWGRLDCHHVHGRQTKANRYGAGVPLCCAHHAWAHAHPRQAREMWG